MASVHIDQRKWPDRAHWQFTMSRLGQDEHGVWLHASGDTIARRGNEPATRLEVGFLTLVPDKRWWMVEFYTDHPRHSVYVNIGTPPEWHGDRVLQIDLDLDVVRCIDGSVLVLDESEFEDHRSRYEYPDELIRGAMSATADAVAMLEQDAEPFASRWTEWMGLARTS